MHTLLSIPILLLVASFPFSILPFALPSSEFSNGEQANLVIGQPNFTSSGCNNPPTPTQSQLCRPSKLTFDSAGNLWVADTSNSRVLEYVPPLSNGMPASLVIGRSNFTSQTSPGCALHPTPSGLCNPAGITFDSAGNLWVADNGNDRVLRYNAPFTTDESASLVIGQPDFASNTCNRDHVTPTGLCSPSGITFDKPGDLWVADWSDDRILEFTPPFANEMPASLLIGQPNFTSSGCNNPPTPIQSQLCRPTELTFDSAGNLWVADSGDHWVLRYNAPFTINESASLLIGQPNFFPYDCGSTSTQTSLCEIGDIVFDSSDNLWVVDTSNSRVFEYGHPFSYGMPASLVIGQPNFTSASCKLSTQAGLCLPDGITFDSAGNLWVADTLNSRILRFSASAKQMTTSTTTATSTSSTSTTSISSSVTTSVSSVTTSGGGNRSTTEFSYQLLFASSFIVLAVISYVIVRRGRTKRLNLSQAS